MANDSGNTGTPSGLVARLGNLLIGLVAGEGLGVRYAIARAAARARPDRDLVVKTRWHARHDPAASSRVE